MKQQLNHSIGILLVLPLLVFFFYKSILSTNPYATLTPVIEEIESLQVELQRDLLRYRNNQVREYDTLNRTARRLSRLNREVAAVATADEYSGLARQLAQLQAAIDDQAVLIEDFKTHNSVVQNSIYYFSQLHFDFRNGNSYFNGAVAADLLGELSFLILEFTRQPARETALKLYPLLDKINTSQDLEVKTLINQALIIVDRLPLIDGIIETLNTQPIERLIAGIETSLSDFEGQLTQHGRIYNSLLFFSALYLLGYLGYMLMLLKQNRNTLLLANEKLNGEIETRIKTEKTLYRLVKESSSIDENEFVHDILYALYKALGYRYTFLSLAPVPDSLKASISGLVENGNYLSDAEYTIAGSPCEEVMREGRLVHNRDFRNYFPDWNNRYLGSAESFIGITFRDHNDRIAGMLAVADDQPIVNSNLAESILSLAASRVSTELLRHNASRDRERFHSGLESIDRQLVELISCAGDTAAFYQTVCEAVLDIADAAMAFVALRSEDAKAYTIVAASGCGSEALGGTRHAIDDGGLVSWVISNRSSIRIDDVETDMRARRQQINNYPVKSTCVTPVFLNDTIYGAIAVFRDAAPFDTIDEQLIHQFTQRAQLALANMALVSEIAAEKERAEFTLHSIGDAVITTDAQGNIEYMNPIAERLTGYGLDAAANQPVQNVFRILDHDTREPVHTLIEACLNEGTTSSKSMDYLAGNNGSERSIEHSISPIVNHAGAVEGAVIVFHDETERRRMECIIHHQATHDSLTGLINRQQFNKELVQLVDHARTHHAEHVLCYLGLDRFKTVNDTCGHAAGDELLKQLSSRLHSSIRTGDILARLGGDEFGLILQNCPVDAAAEIADKIIAAVSEQDFIWEGHTFTVGASIGIAPVTPDTTDANEAMKQADVACYTAKQQGRNRSCTYDQQDTERGSHQEERHWASLISQALEQDRFRLYAQTICALAPAADNTARIEILVRMEDENGQLIPPSAFIPAAERYELMAAVDRHIVRESFRFISENACEGICVSINLSSSALNDDKLSGFIKRCARKYKIPPNLVCFEISEAAAIASLAKTRRLIDALKPEGFRFALDDFGSKLSSFNYLKNFPVDYVKIDGSFVRGMVDNRIDHGMVAAINQIGHIMEMKTIAEFVENEQIAVKLRDLGVDFAQGYGISRPAPLTGKTLRSMTRHTTFSSGLASAS
jgi:diguanylate cyclase (GGDEF)-like protein/PAS domain S-box-containing protein